MPFHVSSVISIIFLLYLGYCIAVPPPLVPALPGRHGIRIRSANCRGNEYDYTELMDAIIANLRNMDEAVRSRLGDGVFEYRPRPGEDLPSGLLYMAPIRLYLATDVQRDIAVHTRDGKLVKVVTQVRTETRERAVPGYKWVMEDCTMTPLMVPAPLMIPPHRDLSRLDSSSSLGSPGSPSSLAGPGSPRSLASPGSSRSLASPGYPGSPYY